MQSKVEADKNVVRFTNICKYKYKPEQPVYKRKKWSDDGTDGTDVTAIHHKGSINMCAKLHGNPSKYEAYGGTRGRVRAIDSGTMTVCTNDEVFESGQSGDPTDSQTLTFLVMLLA